MPMKVLYAAVIAAGCLLAVSPVAAQGATELAGAVHATRGQLEVDLKGFEQVATSVVAAEPQRAQARLQIAALRARLEQGDFHAGDRIAIKVDRDPQQQPASATSSVRPLEQQLSDTFTVGSGQEVSLPVVGAVSMRGVLRAELKAHLTNAVARFIHDPVLHARPLIRLSVQGAVARPGYYTLPIDAALSDALMAAGGPARGAKIGRLRIERDGKSVWTGGPLQRAIAEGRTIGEMSLLAGDQFTLPENRPAVERALRIVGLTLAIPVAIYTISRR